MSPATSGPGPALAHIGRTLGCPERRGHAAWHEIIVWTITDALRRIKLLVVDEAHCLNDWSLDQLRAIHDDARVGIALIGSPVLHARLYGGKSAATLDGLRHRIGKQLGLQGVTQDDAHAMLDAWGVFDGKLRRTLTEATTKPGGMRNAVKALRLAAMLARQERRDPIEADVRAALRGLGD